MKQYQVRSSFMSIKGIIILCILMLINTVFSGIIISQSLQGEWFSVLISLFLLLILVGSLVESRMVKPLGVSKENIVIGSIVVNPEALLRINVSHKQIELTQKETFIFRKVIFVNMVNLEEIKLLTKELLEFSTEHEIKIETIYEV